MPPTINLSPDISCFKIQPTFIEHLKANNTLGTAIVADAEYAPKVIIVF
ncbi:hypothetical protein Nizo1839_0030 [Lactiplantibacillus plantarum]|nr:hypothetical protein SF2A35B_1048 [Lactiplantibacillus plantarum]KZT83738.1 hypothetical protein Nizo1839_0030 [Lactiplantibacillus plantarum]